jgi:hypothetical protein
MDPVWQKIVKNDSNVQESAICMRNWMYMCFVVTMLVLRCPDDNVLLERFCRAMACSVNLEERDTPAKDYIEGFRSLFSRLGSLAGQAYYNPSLLRSHNKPGPHDRMYESRFLELSAGRKFCVTKQDYLAWVPVDTRPTDRICLLAGCAIPFVVRPVDQHFELVGDCYREDMVLDRDLTTSLKP